MAEGSQPEEIVKRLNANLKCSICMQTYIDSRILDCVHSFCFKCICRHVKNSRIIKCPLCKAESPVPVGIGITGLKSNFFIKGLIHNVMHKVKKIETVPVIKKPICGSCDLGKVAKAHCIECACKLCDQCILLHSQLKVLKLHKVTVYPTDEEIKAKKEEVINMEITDIQNDIATNSSKLQAYIVQVQSKIKEVYNERDTTISQVNEAYQIFLKQITTYVQGLTTRIKTNAEKRLGDLPNQLKDFEIHLTTYQTLEKQRKCMLHFELDEKVKLCKELKEQIEKHNVRTSEATPFSSLQQVACIPSVQFESENKELILETLLEQAI